MLFGCLVGRSLTQRQALRHRLLSLTFFHTVKSICSIFIFIQAVLFPAARTNDHGGTSAQVTMLI